MRQQRRSPSRSVIEWRHPEDLRFSADETTLFLQQTMQLEISDDRVAALEARTEGWIAGLQLAALSLHNRDDVDDFITTFAGTQRYILDYLTEEVFDRQPAHLQAFLLQTSILDRLSGPLCDAVCETENAKLKIEKLAGHHNHFPFLNLKR